MRIGSTIYVAERMIQGPRRPFVLSAPSGGHYVPGEGMAPHRFRPRFPSTRMRVPFFAAALLAACACAPAAAAQPDTLVRPGSGEVATAAIPERVDALHLYLGPGMRELAGRMRLRTTFATVQGVDAIIRTEATWVGDVMVLADSFAVDRRTLAPLYYHSSGSGETSVLLFSPGQVRSVFDDGPDTAVVEVPEPVFLSAAMDLVLAALPLAEGYTTRLAVFDPEEGVQTALVEVRGAEEVSLARGRRVPAWRVRVSRGGASGTYWMDRESHTLVQYVNPGRDVRLVRTGDSAPGRHDTR